MVWHGMLSVFRCNIGKCAILGVLFSNARRKWPSTLIDMVSMATFHVSTLVLGMHEVHGVQVHAYLMFHTHVPHYPAPPKKAQTCIFQLF